MRCKKGRGVGLIPHHQIKIYCQFVKPTSISTQHGTLKNKKFHSSPSYSVSESKRPADWVTLDCQCHQNCFGNMIALEKDTSQIQRYIVQPKPFPRVGKRNVSGASPLGIKYQAKSRFRSVDTLLCLHAGRCGQLCQVLHSGDGITKAETAQRDVKSPRAAACLLAASPRRHPATFSPGGRSELQAPENDRRAPAPLLRTPVSTTGPCWSPA